MTKKERESETLDISDLNLVRERIKRGLLSDNQEELDEAFALRDKVKGEVLNGNLPVSALDFAFFKLTEK